MLNSLVDYPFYCQDLHCRKLVCRKWIRPASPVGNRPAPVSFKFTRNQLLINVRIRSHCLCVFGGHWLNIQFARAALCPCVWVNRLNWHIQISHTMSCYVMVPVKPLTLYMVVYNWCTASCEFMRASLCEFMRVYLIWFTWWRPDGVPFVRVSRLYAPCILHLFQISLLQFFKAFMWG